MHILIISERKTRQIGWTLGVCGSCGGWEAIRVEDLIKTTKLWFIPLDSSVVGRSLRCDFCERFLRGAPTKLRTIEFRAWTPADGLQVLAQRLGGDPTVVSEKRDADKRIHSLLGGIAHSTSINNINVDLGITTGLIVGGLFGLLVGLFVLPYFNMRMDATGKTMAGLFGGCVIGLIVGALATLILRRRSLPLRRLVQICNQYGLSVSDLEKAADRSAARVRRAVHRLRDELAIGDLLPPHDG
jgi:hypothetical protein